jgi:hypothetical protein
MSYRLRGIIDSFELKGLTGTPPTNARQIGQLVTLATDGKVVPGAAAAGNFHYPLLLPATVNGEHVSVQVTGVAKVSLEPATVVNAGDVMVVNANGNVIVGVAGPDEVGVALEASTANQKSHIAILLKN